MYERNERKLFFEQNPKQTLTSWVILLQSLKPDFSRTILQTMCICLCNLLEHSCIKEERNQILLNTYKAVLFCLEPPCQPLVTNCLFVSCCMIGKLFMNGADSTRAQSSKFIRVQRSLLNDRTSITINSVYQLSSPFGKCVYRLSTIDLHMYGGAHSRYVFFFFFF